MTQRPNIAQIEFFGVLEKLLVVRLYDDGGFITNIALRLEQMEKNRESLHFALTVSKGAWRRFILDFRLRRLARKIFNLKKQAVAVAFQQLDAAIHTSQQVAIERTDYRFRLAGFHEVYKLLEKARRAESAWLFVFKPNDLLADSNTYVACAM